MPHRKTYHHGNLREALVDGAVDLIELSGPQSFSLAEAARRAGVSPAAPYRHFKSREDLLEEVARRGYVEFAEKMDKVYDDGKPNPLAALARLGNSYLEFAQERPGYYQAMFESGISVVENPELWEAAEASIGILVRASEELFAHFPVEDRPPPRMVANHIWAMSHGVVELFARSKQGARSPISPDDMLSSGVLIYLRGLGVIGN
ncbi:DNA-binding transcriptional regulator, AcrR family [Paracoccus isoporae]|uniref:DNA-binding transcriptional regulator, AcrR family n=1 Tax=Paracoccus isoporae TaxID=591205 RepID=A0A1G6SKY2_9RHOB|nr:TetR/AcrR family transcriptional regulator [Paracoccus isoporae]SDD16785.1 DNA-binding transcriptional regulator, AcrR family [Paracoccus isoporae]